MLLRFLGGELSAGRAVGGFAGLWYFSKFGVILKVFGVGYVLNR